jgi:hypothetical protein
VIKRLNTPDEVRQAVKRLRAMQRPVLGNIGSAVGITPSIATKARNFAASAAKHVAAGMPQATDEQVAARFAICQTCEHFDGTACRQCGCPVVREKKFLSKLSWANESCPVGKWGPVSS